jgi:hypothetical protein
VLQPLLPLPLLLLLLPSAGLFDVAKALAMGLKVGLVGTDVTGGYSPSMLLLLLLLPPPPLLLLLLLLSALLLPLLLPLLLLLPLPPLLLLPCAGLFDVARALVLGLKVGTSNRRCGWLQPFYAAAAAAIAGMFDVLKR